MEPMNATVHVRKDSCEIWTGTQVLTRAQAVAAKLTGLPLEKVTVHNHLLGGGFGRRLEVDGVVRAVQVAMQVDGPVKLVYTREQDIQHDMYKPAFHDRLVAGLDAQGAPVAWSHRLTGSSIIARWAPPRSRTVSTGTLSRRRRDSVRVPEHAGRVRAPRAARHPDRFLARRRSGAQRLRRRELHGRARRKSRKGSGRVPTRYRRPESKGGTRSRRDPRRAGAGHCRRA